VKIRPVLADTGRLVGSAVNLLNAGWTFTTAVPWPQGGWTLPDQALALFIQASWEELNQPVPLRIELSDDNGAPAHFAPGPEHGGAIVVIEHSISVAPVPNAPSGTPGLANVLIDMPAGTLWVSSPSHRYIWRVTSNDVSEEIGFWVQPATQSPVLQAGMPITRHMPSNSG
jgi:hypothetical protein